MSGGLKPYPGTKDSRVPWLGDIPGHWDVLPARAVYKAKLRKNSGMARKTVLSLSYGHIVVKPEEKLRGLVPESFETYQLVDPGDVIVRTTDLQNDRTSLRIGFSNHQGIITSAYMCLGVTDRFLPKFGYEFLNAYDLLKIIYGFGSGLRQNLDFGDIKQMPVLVPPLGEQAAIIRFLDHADRHIRRYIAAKKKLIVLLNEQKQDIVYRAVTRGLDPDVSLKPSGVPWLGDVPEHWQIWQIGHFARVGNGSTPSRGNTAYWSNGHYPWLNSSSVNHNPILASDQFVTDVALRECHLPRVQPGSVLVAITGQGKTRGTAALLAVEATINQHIAFIAPRQDVVRPEYLQLLLVGAYRELRRISDDSGSTKGALTCADISHFKAALPPRDEQDQIIDRAAHETHDVQVAVARTEREIHLLHEYRARLIVDVVIGKLDVREAAAQMSDQVEEAEPLGASDALLEGDESEDDPDLYAVIEEVVA